MLAIVTKDFSVIPIIRFGKAGAVFDIDGDGIGDVVGVDGKKIYNEVSCGKLDPGAIRDFLKFAFDRWSRKPFYVLFFRGR